MDAGPPLALAWYLHVYGQFNQGNGVMIWLYERGDQVLKIETRFDKDSLKYELVWHDPDGSVRRESFETEEAFRVRLENAEATLRKQEWFSSGPPRIDIDGWRAN